uniref:NADH-ubiquinone oxidoreductase chain 6 n=1 Tax=Stygiocaris lancifera TaxID=481991 RepID=A0A1Z2R723_STYLA|nr:NADH dehydrogenase subunit 6 [Stygiocaris lancifera]ASA39512.1 NADH dehydrogenase subunit 6 [Stygiocaris lancifera]
MSLMTSMIIITLTLSIVFTKIIHPLVMGAILLMQTTIIAMMTTFTLKTAWFSYILFLIFLGAMLVLFIYVASLAPNESLSLSYPLSILFATSTIVSISIMTLDPFLLPNPIFCENSDMKTPMMSITMNMFLHPMYNEPTMKLTLFLILYLLLTLMVVVKITTTHFGPLRSN